MSEVAPPSPCIRICCLDDAGICLGCFRSLGEITAWREASAAEQHAIVARSAERRAAHEARWPTSFTPRGS